MNKTELVVAMAEESGMKRKESEAALDAILTQIEEQPFVQIRGFFSFKKKVHAARQGRNPSTGDPISIPAKTVIISKPLFGL
jgi:DNA-binding protein HU-beta